MMGEKPKKDIMAEAKYKKFYKLMREKESELFEEFAQSHQAYKENKEKAQDEFNRVGEKVLDVIRDWDRRLCSAMGRTVYGQYSQQVSEKFWDLIREDFDQIDMVGVKIER